MKLIKVAAAVLNQTPLAWESNRDNIIRAIEAARAAQVQVLCLPELCITGYGCEDAFLAPGVQRTAVEILAELKGATEGMIVSLGLPVLCGGALFNAVCLVADGAIAGLVGKQHLPSEGIHYEPRWFKPWPADTVADIDVGGQRVPMGDVMFVCDGVNIGFEVCEDAWVAERPGGELARRGADIILNPSASHFAFGKHAVRRRFVLEGSRAFHVNYIYANLLGNEAGRAIYDGDALIASAGQLLATAPRFSFRDFHLTTAVVDIDYTRMLRTRDGSFRPDVFESGRHHVDVAFEFAPQNIEATQPHVAEWETSEHLKEEEFTRAEALGLFDYMRKSRSRGFVVSLSGGADSAAVATLVALTVQFGMAELGESGFRAKLGYVKALDECRDVRSAVRKLLTCVYQATRNSSETTRNAARSVADQIGANFLEFEIDPVVDAYIDLISGAIGRPLSWQRDDLALQNIQARVRAPSVWMLANLHGALLLATSNRSEAAVGYATMDGDTAGGLSPIAGIDKAYLLHWLRWLEQTGPHGHEPLPALRAVNEQRPTAELRPQSAGQTDEDDLMPYAVLDTIERAAIRDQLMPVEIFQHLAVQYGETYSRQQLGQWVERFFRLWSRNQWKRERYAPSFHLDDENLDPKTWCRFPILSGGFERELEALRRVVGTESNSRNEP